MATGVLMDDWPSITPIIMITRVQYFFFFCLLSYRFWYQDPGGGGPPSQSQKPQKRTETFKSKAEMIFLVRLVRQSSRWLSILLFLGGGGLADLWESLTSLFIYVSYVLCVWLFYTHTQNLFFFLFANRPFWVFADGDFYFRSGSQAPNGWVIYGSSHLV
jgi:hypothetical protein